MSARPLLASEEQKFFAELCRGPWAFVFDFDGTLAPLHPDPKAVRINLQPREALRILKKDHPVYVITGRALRHIVRKVPKGVPIIAEHGASSTEKDYRLSGYELDVLRAKLWRKAIQRHLKDEGLKQEVWIEPKDYSIAVHYRHSKDPRKFEKKLKAWVDEFPEKDRPDILPGKKVFNLLPSPAPTKGEAIKWILERLPRGTRLLYVGDEPTDENAFRALGKRHFTVFVGPKSRTAARFRLPSQKAFEGFLHRTALAVQGAGKKSQPPKRVTKSSQ